MRALEPRAQWSTEAHLLAGVIDLLQQHTWVYIEAHKAKGKSNPKPQPLLRPGRVEAAEPQAPARATPERRISTPQELAMFLAGTLS